MSYPLPQRGEIHATGETCPDCGAPIVEIVTARGPWRICVNMDCPSKEKKTASGRKAASGRTGTSGKKATPSRKTASGKKAASAKTGTSGRSSRATANRRKTGTGAHKPGTKRAAKRSGSAEDSKS